MPYQSHDWTSHAITEHVTIKKHFSHQHYHTGQDQAEITLRRWTCGLASLYVLYSCFLAYVCCAEREILITVV